ncbi:MAG: lamin tail domain-containing protein, partial [Verrucomicrobiota bacterium]
MMAELKNLSENPVKTPPAFHTLMFATVSRLLVAAFFCSPVVLVAQQIDDVVISEIMFFPDETIVPEAVGEEFIEITNRGTTVVDLSGWEVSRGVNFLFPATLTLDPGARLAISADPVAFAAKYPGVANVVGPWTGRLSNSGESIRLKNGLGVEIDEVVYADQGNEWGVRGRGEDDLGFMGWAWSDLADGGKKSLELINLLASNKRGQNWMASVVDGGTPGAVNSVDAADIAPRIFEVRHEPAIPRSEQPVTVTAEFRDEALGATGLLYWRLDGAPTFQTVPLLDDGLSGDDLPGDGRFGGMIPAQAHGSIIEFYIEASDTGGLTRIWPRQAGAPEANALYRVDDEFDFETATRPGGHPHLAVVMTAAETAELALLASDLETLRSNAQMNATVVSVDVSGIDIHYSTGFRIRGNGARKRDPLSYRINFTETWKGIKKLNLNSTYSWRQYFGMQFAQKSMGVGQDSWRADVFINGVNPASDSRKVSYFSYVAMEAPDSQFARNHYPEDGNGNLYKPNATLSYRGPESDRYSDRYQKQTNESDGDWTDLADLT